MRYISLFSGIEAASVAWRQLGWEPVAFSEIEPFPCALLKERFPNVPNLGDITKIDWTPYVGAVDIIVGGSPCQSFSIAGNREGLRGESGLMFEFIRAVRCVRPAYFVWENVPGALSCEGGAAFGQLLREMDDIGYGLAWRVLDAQFFGVPQRRRRVFLVGSLGNMRCAEVLSERESVRWDAPPNTAKREELADRARERLMARHLEIPRKDVRNAHGERSGRVRARWEAPVHAYTLQVRCGCEGGGKGALIQEDMSATLATVNMQTLFQPIGFSSKASPSAGSVGAVEEQAPTLLAVRQDACVCYCLADDNAKAAIDENLCGSLKCGGSTPIVAECDPPEYIVRRLTPLECERLQGFPDGWTDIEGATDTQRYKALGNTMAVPNMLWIGQRIQRLERMNDGKATA